MTLIMTENIKMTGQRNLEYVETLHLDLDLPYGVKPEYLGGNERAPNQEGRQQDGYE
jgi:hypothetical protein